MLTRRQFTTTLGGAMAAGLLAPGAGRAQAAPIKLGSIFSYTGPAAFLGDRMKRSVELFVEEANKKGGLGGRRIELTLYDAGSESTKAVLAAKRLIEQDGVEVIVGDGNRSDIGLALVPSVQRAEVPLMSVSGATALVEPVKERGVGLQVHRERHGGGGPPARLLQEARHQGRGDAERHRRLRGERAGSAARAGPRRRASTWSTRSSAPATTISPPSSPASAAATPRPSSAGR